MPGRKMVLTSKDLLRLHKSLKTIVNVSNKCKDPDVKRALEEISGRLITCVEYTQRLISITKKRPKRIRRSDFDFDPFNPDHPTPDEE